MHEHPTLRIHSLNVGFFDENGKAYDSKKIIVDA